MILAESVFCLFARCGKYTGAVHRIPFGGEIKVFESAAAIKDKSALTK